MSLVTTVLAYGVDTGHPRLSGLSPVEHEVQKLTFLE